MLFDEFIFRVRRTVVLLISGDKPETDCVLAPAVPGEVRQNHSKILLGFGKLLGVGFKGSHTDSSGAAHFYDLAAEVKLVLARKLCEVFVWLRPGDQGLPLFCVVTPDDGAKFEEAAKSSRDNKYLNYSALRAAGLQFLPIEAAVQKLLGAYDKFGRQQRLQDYLVATAGMDDKRGKNLAGRKTEERRCAEAGFSVRSCCGALKTQFELLPLLYEEARAWGRAVRMACYVSTVASDDPETWKKEGGVDESVSLCNRIDMGNKVYVPTDASTVSALSFTFVITLLIPVGGHLDALLPHEGLRRLAARGCVLCDDGAHGADVVLAPPWGKWTWLRKPRPRPLLLW